MVSSVEITDRPKPRIKWYRCPVDRESMKELGEKSDLRGLIQAVGHLAILGLTGSCAWLAAEKLQASASRHGLVNVDILSPVFFIFNTPCR